MHCILLLLLALLTLLLDGCAHLPDYALPHIGVMNSNQVSLKQGLTYRKLMVSDFRSPTLPDHLVEHSKKFYAHSRIQIRPTKDSKFIVNSSYSYYYNKIIWTGSMKSIAFEAVMLPDYSWWNPEASPQKTAYVLQHEQIHFALMELAARQLTQQAREDIDAIFVIDSTRQGAHEQLLEKIESLIQTKNEEILKEHTAFDQDTSLYPNPKKQRWWFDRVNNQLQDNSL